MGLRAQFDRLGVCLLFFVGLQDGEVCHPRDINPSAGTRPRPRLFVSMIMLLYFYSGPVSCRSSFLLPPETESGGRPRFASCVAAKE